MREVAGTLVADVVVQVTPEGGAGRLEILSMGSTTLLQPADPRTAERLPEGYAVDRTVAGPDPADLTLTVVPGRCDAHAIAEDKQGTLFPVLVSLDGEEGLVTVAAPDEVRAAPCEFVRR